MKTLSRVLWVLVILTVCSVDAKKKGKWTIGKVTKSPINDAPSVGAVLLSDSGTGAMVIGCNESNPFIFFNVRMYVSSPANFRPPIIYRVGSEPAVDCTDYDPPDKCMKFGISADDSGVGIYDSSDNMHAFIDEIKSAKTLTVRLSNLRGGEKTAVFTLGDLLKTFDKIKSLCGISEPTTPENAGAAP